MTLNPNVNVDTERSQYADVFTPDDGYALWRDNEESNQNPETGEPICYSLTMRIPKTISESYAPHIWARLIVPSTEVDGKVVPANGEMSEIEEKAKAYDILMGVSE